MNKKFAKNPEKAIKKAEKKCPMVLAAHDCHKACPPGDHECHHKCPSLFHVHDGEHHDEEGHEHFHHKHWHEKMHKEMEEAHACHKKCGSDRACHFKCPQPWAPFVKACQDFPAIKACHETCKDSECDKCPKFEVEWMNKKFAKNPEK